MNIASLGKQVVSVLPHNAQRGLPIVHAAVLVLEGGTLTAIRTGAASGAATDPLARSDSQLWPFSGPACRAAPTGDQVEEGGLAGGIGTDRAGDGAWRHLHRHVMDCHQPAKGLTQIVRGEDGGIAVTA